jgi:hypothetical protein
VRVRFTPEARLAVREKRVWWEQHREKAPRLFVEELAAVVAKLREGIDEERQQYAARSGRIIWRLLMSKQHRLCATHIASTSLTCAVGSRDATDAPNRAFIIANTVSTFDRRW